MTTRFADHLLDGDHATRPAAAAVPTGTLYACSDHGLIYQSDGAAWATWATLGGGGGASGWQLDAALPLSTLTGWTAGAGTWSASSGVIRQGSTSNGAFRLHFNTMVPLAEVVAEVDVRLDATPNNISSRGGFVFGTPAASDGGNGQLVALVSKGSTTQATAVDFEKDAVASYGQGNLPSPIPNGTWATLRVHKVGSHFAAYVDGVLVTSWGMVSEGRQLGRLALYSYASDVSFRNLSVWTPALP